jgi:hypothetical protein
MKSINSALLLFAGISLFLLNGCGEKYTLDEQESFTLVLNKGGQTLGYAPGTGVTLIEKSGYAFKDLNKNGVSLWMKELAIWSGRCQWNR